MTYHTERSNDAAAFVYPINSHLVHMLQEDVSVPSRLLLQVFNTTEP